VPAMKVTLSAAMRARDVSRPRDGQLADAEAAEAILASSAPASSPPASSPPASSPPASLSPADAVRGTDAGDGARDDTGRESAGSAGRDTLPPPLATPRRGGGAEPGRRRGRRRG
jgi:hypothetical protein